MGLSESDSHTLDRIMEALERMAAADERRNELLTEDAAERKAMFERDLEIRTGLTRDYIDAVKAEGASDGRQD